MPKQNDEVEQFLLTLTHPMKAEIEKVREIILGSNPEITERIKWNAPSFCYEDEDRVTFKLFPYDSIQLIFHRGAKVQNTKEFTFTDSSGLLKTITADRYLLTFHDMKEIEANTAVIIKAVNDWMIATKE